MYSVKKITYFIFIFLLICASLSTQSSAQILERGDRGQQVEEIQTMLDNIGYDVEIDGVFGPWTERAVKDFQYNNNLKVDGIMGTSTRNALQNMQGEIEYEIKPGDTLIELAQKYNTSVKNIKERNNLKNETIIAGDIIKIPFDGTGGVHHDSRSRTEERQNPPSKYITHQIQPGESLSVIANRYGTSIETIQLSNNLKGSRIYAGQEIKIPNPAADGSFHLSENSFIWPLMGRISSPFGYRTHPVSGERDFHSGLDIAAPSGTIIRAAASGKVILSEWLSGYGKTIVIKHSPDVKTLYAHNSTLLVSEGQEVEIGQPISRVGSTGVSTGPHLHFEVQVNGNAVNPVDYLP